MRNFFAIGLMVVVSAGMAGCWDFATMRKTSMAEFSRQQETRLPVAREKAAGFAGLSEAERGRVMKDKPEMHVEVENEFFARFDVYTWPLEGGRALTVTYERLEPNDEKAWKVTAEGAKRAGS